MVDVVAVPDRLEHAVREAHREEVLHRLLAEVVVDPEDLRLVEDLVHARVELSRRGEVGAERLLHDHARALVQPQRSELRRRCRQTPPAGPRGSAAAAALPPISSCASRHRLRSARRAPRRCRRRKAGSRTAPRTPPSVACGRTRRPPPARARGTRRRTSSRARRADDPKAAPASGPPPRGGTCPAGACASRGRRWRRTARSRGRPESGPQASRWRTALTRRSPSQPPGFARRGRRTACASPTGAGRRSRPRRAS